MKILIIDSNSNITTMLERFFILKGYKAVGVVFPENALAMIQSKHFDVLITDCHLPGLNGIDLIKRAKSTGFKGKVILISGNDDFDYIVKENDEIVDRFIRKPFLLNDVHKVLTEIIN